MPRWLWMAGVALLFPLSGCLPNENFNWFPKRAVDAPPAQQAGATTFRAAPRGGSARPRAVNAPARRSTSPAKVAVRTKPKCKT